jgi:hypothetical protein
VALTAVQTDTAASCTNAVAGTWCSSSDESSTPIYRSAAVSGTPGTGTPQVGFASSVASNRGVFFVWDVPAGTTWTPGDWTINLNITTSNMNLTWTTLAIGRLNSACVYQAASCNIKNSGIAQSLGTTGVKSTTITGVNLGSPAVGDKVFIALGFDNTAMSVQTFNFTPNQNIDSPFTAAAVFIAPPPKLITQQSRNRASLY